MDTEYKVRVGVIPRAAHCHDGVPGGTAPTRCMRDAYAANQATPTPPRENVSWCAPSKSSNNGRETLGKESNGKTMNNEPRPGTTVVVPSRYNTVCMYSTSIRRTGLLCGMLGSLGLQSGCGYAAAMVEAPSTIVPQQTMQNHRQKT